MNNKIILLSLMLVCIFALNFVSCGNSGASLLGMWDLERVENGPSSNMITTFHLGENGEGMFSDGSGGMPMTWKVEKDRITITAYGQSQTIDYIISGDTFTLVYDKSTNYRSIYKRINNN
ncbi:MAG: hypothetical protein FWD26_07190 [Treponema sp.]|nr:hypothetical protein [Treponema sp.]